MSAWASARAGGPCGGPLASAAAGEARGGGGGGGKNGGAVARAPPARGAAAAGLPRGRPAGPPAHRLALSAPAAAKGWPAAGPAAAMEAGGGARLRLRRFGSTELLPGRWGWVLAGRIGRGRASVAGASPSFFCLPSFGTGHNSTSFCCRSAGSAGKGTAAVEAVRSSQYFWLAALLLFLLTLEAGGGMCFRYHNPEVYLAVVW